MPTTLTKADSERIWKQQEQRRRGFYSWATRAARTYRREETERAAEAVRQETNLGRAAEAAMRALRGRDAAEALVLRIGRQVVPAFAAPEWERLTALRKAGGRKADAKGTLRRKASDDPPEDLWLRWVQDYLAEEAAAKVRKIAETVREDIRAVLAAALEDGDGIDAMARRLTREAAGINRSRAVVIARTEVISASNQGSHFGARSVAERYGMTLNKEWIDTPDGRTRDPHRAAGGQVVAYDKPFIVGGEKLMWPGDTSLGASASNTIQCRCTQAYVPEDG